MKTLACISLILLGSYALHAGPSCDRLEQFDSADLRAQVDRDLVSNIWHSTLFGSEATLYFQVDGSLLVVPDEKSQVCAFQWRLDARSEFLVLHMDCDKESREYVISPTCNGLCALAQGECTPILIEAEAAIDKVQADFLRDRLAGTWLFHERKLKRQHTLSAFQLEIQADGTFTFNNGPDLFHSAQSGIWQISPDGRFLILFVRMYRDGNEVYCPETLVLRSVDFEDLVIDAEHLPRLLEPYAGEEPLLLSKVMQ